MEFASTLSGDGRCDAVREWLSGQPLRDNSQMAGARPSLSWDAWVEKGRNAPGTEDCLLELLEQEQDADTRSNIAMALGYVGGDRAIGGLIGQLKDREPIVVMEAAAALGRIGHRDAVPHLIEVMKSDDPNVRANVSQALGALGGDEATAALTASLRDGDPFVRLAARDALARRRR